MKLRQSIFSALLLAVGYVLHLVAAPFMITIPIKNTGGNFNAKS